MQRPAAIKSSMRRYAPKAIEFLRERMRDRAHADAVEETEESKRHSAVCLLVLYHLNNPLTNYFCSAYCDWMQTLGPEELKMSVSYGIKPNWAVVLRTKENIQRLAYHLHVVEKVISIFVDPKDYFYMNEMHTEQVK